MTLHELPSPQRIQRVQVTPADAHGHVTVTIVLSTARARGPWPIDAVSAAVVDGDSRLNGTRATFRLTFDRASAQPPPPQNVTVTIGASGTVVLENITVPLPRLWRPEDPQLHTLAVQWLRAGGDVDSGGADRNLKGNAAAPGAALVDGMEVRFGLRTVSVQQRRVAINGRPVYLRGFNRHDMHPTFGASLPLSQLQQDVALVQKANANWLRGCHYLQDQRWLDLLDERGILFWEEVGGG